MTVSSIISAAARATPRGVSNYRFKEAAAHLPLSRIIDALNFADKANAPLLQLADLCAFYGKKFLVQDQRAMRLLSCLDPQVAEISAWSPS